MEIRTLALEDGQTYKRELLLDDQVVGWLFVNDYQMRIGAATARMAGIGGVETRREHRNKGYMRILFEDTVRYMTGQNYDVSMLFGISNFYTKFGYAVCLAEYRQIIQTRDAEEVGRAAEGTVVRPFEARHIDAVRELYNGNNATRTASLVRLAPFFTGFRKGSWWDRQAEAWVLEDEAGRLLAYAALDRSNTEVNVIEVESTDSRLFAALLHELAQTAIRRRCGEIHILIPPDHPFAEYAQQCGCKWEIRCEKNGGGMMRILNLYSLFQKIDPELRRRVALSSQWGSRAALTFKTDLGAVTVDVQPDAVRVISGEQDGLRLSLSQDRLMQLMAGYRSVGDLLNDPQVQADGHVRPWLEALFPPQRPFVWLADYF